MPTVPRLIATVAMLLTSACGRPVLNSSESLVGAQELPSVDDLSREIIQINSGFGDGSMGFLSYELRPDGTLAVTYEARHRDKVVGSETFRLAPEVAMRARRMLWRLRPTSLEGQGLTRDEIRPVGCQRQGPHDFGEYAVVFIDEGEKREIEDDRLGAFELPTPESCNTPTASEARQVVGRVLQSFPYSRVAAAFPKPGS
jgi:hypothetical protein